LGSDMIQYMLMKNLDDGGLDHLGNYDTLCEAENAKASYEKMFSRRNPSLFIFRSDLTPRKETLISGSLF